jgi:hypothetical protein
MKNYQPYFTLSKYVSHSPVRDSYCFRSFKWNWKSPFFLIKHVLKMGTTQNYLQLEFKLFREFGLNTN